MYELLMFAYANNFMNYANYAVILCFGYCLYKSKFKIVKPKSMVFLWLFFGSLLYCVLYLRNYEMPERSTFMLRFIVPVLMFYIGVVLAKQGVDKIKKEIIIIAFAGCIHGVLNVVTNRNLDILSIAGRQYQDIYGGPISGTLQNLFFIASTALLFYFFVCTQNKWLKILGTIAGCSGMIASVINASRTMIFVTVIIFFISMIFYIYEKHGFGTMIFRTILIVSALLTLILIVMWLDLFGIQEILANSALGRREATAVASSSVSQNLRWKYASDILKMLPDNLLGGIDYSHYAHNLWVDIAKEAGIIPFVLYILFTVSSIINCYKYCANRSNELVNRILFFSIIITYLLVFFTEPIMNGSPISFGLFAFVVGALGKLNYDGTVKASETIL